MLSCVVVIFTDMLAYLGMQMELTVLIALQKIDKNTYGQLELLTSIFLV